MTSKVLLLLVCLSNQVSSVLGNAGVFAYYETAIAGLGGRGPSQWQNLIFPPAVAPFGNQCGGNGQQNGFGQSPVAIPPQVESKCDADMTGYEFEQPTCTWDDVWFRILNNVRRCCCPPSRGLPTCTCIVHAHITRTPSWQ